MDEYLISKIKKYLFFASLIFSLFFGVHISYLYLYQGAIETPIEGGTISEAIIGSFPHFNPLLASNDHNRYINRLLYRSLLSYDIQNQKFVSDIASCNTSNLIYVECFLENNVSWSNGKPITIEDIISTFNIIKKTNINPSIAALLKDTTLEKGEGKIIFTNVKKDINFLNIFLQPILPKDTIDSLTSEMLSGNFSPTGGIYSGKFILSSVSQDETVGITKITLEKNKKFFQNNIYIDKIIFKLFTDNTQFLKHKSTINFFNDKDNIVGDSVPRLNSVFYSLPQFVSLFVNQENVIDRNIRNFILDSVKREDIQAVLSEQKVSPVLNPYFSETNTDINFVKDIKKILSSKGYLTKQELSQSTVDIKEKEKEIISEEVNIKKPKQEILTVITSPTTKKYNFASENNILLKGNVNKKINAVYINDYKLLGFTPGDSNFYYRLGQDYGTMKIGRNNYKIYFEIDGEKILQEEIVYIFDRNAASLLEIEKDFFAAPTNPEKTSKKNQTSLNMGEIDALDSRFYYDNTGKPFTLVLAHNNSEPLLVETAQLIQKKLEEMGVKVDLKSLSLTDISNGLRDESLYYDAMLVGIDLGYFDSNLYSYFHSSQVKNGYNFANYKQLGLDILLEELKSNNLPNTKKGEIEEKILKIFSKEPIFKVLYSPKTRLLVDKSISKYNLVDFIPDSVHRFDPILSSYLTKKKIIQLENKGFLDAIQFIFTSLF